MYYDFNQTSYYPALTLDSEILIISIAVYFLYMTEHIVTAVDTCGQTLSAVSSSDMRW